MIMQCDHIGYDDYFERCNGCGLTGEHIHASECVPQGNVQLGEDGRCSWCGTMITEEE